VLQPVPTHHCRHFQRLLSGFKGPIEDIVTSMVTSFESVSCEQCNPFTQSPSRTDALAVLWGLVSQLVARGACGLAVRSRM
jgi:hypothetical protein